MTTTTMTTIAEKHSTQLSTQIATQPATQPEIPPFSAPLHLPLANAYWHQGVRSWTRCRHLAVEHMMPILAARGKRNEDSSVSSASFALGAIPHFSPEYPAFLRREIFRKDHAADPGNNPFPVDGGDLACIFEDVTYVAIRPEWDRVTIMGGMGRGGVKSESARR